MMRTFLKTLALTAALGSASLAAPTTLQLAGTPTRAVLTSTTPIQFSYDPAVRLLVIVEGQLQDGAALIEGLTVEQSSTALSIKLPAGYRVTPSPDGLQLTMAADGAGSSAPAEMPSSAFENVTAKRAEPELYPLAYAQPAQVAQLLSEMFSGVRVRVDERQQALVVLVDPADKEAVERLIAKIDVPSPQVSFEAQVIEVNRSLTRSLGIDYDKLFTFKFTELTPEGIFNLGTLTRSPISFGFNLNLLETSGASKVLAKPRVTALNGVEARVNATQTYPLIVTGGSNTTPVVQNITTGITLNMLPRVSKTGEIEVRMSISVSTPTGFTSDGAPQYSSRDATTTIRVKDGEPIAIGGLIENRRIEGVSKVPLLGDIPLLGKLFQKTSTDERETDLVIIVTPKIIPAR
jgi:general secretion pathway protein D